MTKRTRTPLKATKREDDLSELLESSDLSLPSAGEQPQEVAPVAEQAAQAEEPKPEPQKPAKAPAAPKKKPRGIDPYKGSTKLDAYAAPQVVEAIKWLAAEDGRSQGFIVRKYLDIEGLLADARAAGFEEE
ncbi:hypothetical protein ACJJIU_22310 (plasmid) [Microbulbifer sp. CnH-101-E]|uniref:hypothetical protein n=1 Tax=unclassified Microbulbifer TaxID=2619833 RepID=UPI0040398CE8